MKQIEIIGLLKNSPIIINLKLVANFHFDISVSSILSVDLFLVNSIDLLNLSHQINSEHFVEYFDPLVKKDLKVVLKIP